MQKFTAKIQIIDVNPYVELPDEILKTIQTVADKKTSPIPVRGTIEDHPFTQTLVKFRGLWRLYLNTPMRKHAKKETGDTARFALEYDPHPPVVPMIPELQRLLQDNPKAKEAFAALPAYRQKELKRYLATIKNPDTLLRNVEKVRRYLLGLPVEGVLFR